MAGLVAVCLGALVFGVPGSAGRQLDDLQSALMSVHFPVAAPVADSAARQGAAGRSLFPEPRFVTVRVDGVSISPDRKAALIAIDGQAADWLTLGDMRNSVTLMDVKPDEALVDTDSGQRHVKLGEGHPASQAASPDQATSRAVPSLPPVGFAPPKPSSGAISSFPPFQSPVASTLR